MFGFPECEGLIRTRVAAVLPEVVRRFRIRGFVPGAIEAQLTFHGDGHYYKVHNDNGSAKTAARVLSYVYYFCREPARFRGGELRIYDAAALGGRWKRGSTSYRIAPKNNRIVFFLSRYHHEVLPVVCPSRRFVDGRFTINGWIRKKEQQIVRGVPPSRRTARFRPSLRPRSGA